MLGIIGRKSLTTALVASVLFCVFANPIIFKKLLKWAWTARWWSWSGLMFQQPIFYSGILLRTVLFGLMMLLIVPVINNSMLNHVVEGFTEHNEHNEQIGKKINYK